MEKKTTKTQAVLKKVGVLSAIFLVQGVLLFGFYTRQGWFENSTFQQLREIYVPSVAHAIRGLDVSAFRNMAAAIGIFPGNSEGPVANAAPEEPAARSIPILVYHGVVEEADGTNILLDDFYSQMEALSRAGYRTLTFEEFRQFARSGEAPPRSVLITFDDGRKDSYYPVDPVLRTFGFEATMFVLPKRSLDDEDNGYYLNHRELEQMQASGRWSLESHSYDAHEYYPFNASGFPGYYYANKLWLEDEGRIETNEEFRSRVEADFLKSRNKLEEAFGITVDAIALPFGEYGQNSQNYPAAKEIVPELARDAYDFVFYQTNPGNGFSYYDPSGSDRLVRRIEVDHTWDGEDLLSVLEMGSEKRLPFSDTFDEYTAWIRLWGDFALKNGSLMLSNGDYSNETFVFLDGRQEWTDYEFTMRASLQSSVSSSTPPASADTDDPAEPEGPESLENSESSVLLIFAMHDDDYLYCSFGKDGTFMGRFELGKEEVLEESALAMPAEGAEADYFARLEGNTASCGVDGAEYLSHEFETTPSGTIGMKLRGKGATLTIQEITAAAE